VSLAEGRQVREALDRPSGAGVLDDYWLFQSDRGRNRLCKLSRRILAVASLLDAAAIRAGVCRTLPACRLARVPSLSVMTGFYRAHPAFVVDAQGRVQPLHALDYREELGACDRLFVDVFRSSWIGVLDHESFQAACMARGMTAQTFAARSPCSAILDEAPGDIWFLRGTRISPITAAALRHAKSALSHGVAFGEEPM
jgi:hypothetical protein